VEENLEKNWCGKERGAVERTPEEKFVHKGTKANPE